MASARESTKRRLLRLSFPFLFKLCPQENYHWFRDRFCFCGLGQHSDAWHGGVWDFRNKVEIASAFHIAEDFFCWLEAYHPLKRFWEAQNTINLQKGSEDYPYRYFRQIAMKKLKQLIESHYHPGWTE